jgi:hypothetical protein
MTPEKPSGVSAIPICPIHHTEMIVCEISMDGKVLGYMYACTDQDCGEAEDCDTPEGYPKVGELSRYAMEKDAD